MSQALGSKAQIIFQEESTFKTDPGTPDCKKLHFESESLRLSRNLITTNIIRSDRNPVAPVRGNVDVAGTITTHLQAFQLGTILKAALGSVTTTGTGPYTHVFKIGSSLPSLLIEKGFTDIDQYFKYNGCKVNRVSFSIRSEGYQQVSFDFIGAKETTGSVSFDSTPTDGGYQPWDGFSVASILEGGSSIATVTEVDGTIENNLDGSVYVIGGSGERVSLPVGAVKVSGTIRAIFEDLTLYNKAINHTESSLKVVYQLGDGSGSAGNEYFELLLPELKYSPNAPVVNGPQGVLVELPFEAYYDDSSEASAIQITLKNTEATL